MLVVLGAVLPGALLIGSIAKRTLDDNRHVIENRLADTARVDAAALDREFNATIRVLETLAQSTSLSFGDLRSFLDEAKRAVQTQRGWYALILLTPDGHQRLHTEVPFGDPLPDAREPASLERLLLTRKPVVGTLARSRRTGKCCFRSACRWSGTASSSTC